MKIELQPFGVPGVVYPNCSKPGSRQDGITPTKGILLSEVDADELSTMCDDFRKRIFERAGKADPKSITA